jgi:hypothetical protein
MRESSTQTWKPKKLQTATMKRRALKLKSVEALPTKARSPQVRALVVSRCSRLACEPIRCPLRVLTDRPALQFSPVHAAGITSNSQRSLTGRTKV